MRKLSQEEREYLEGWAHATRVLDGMRRDTAKYIITLSREGGTLYDDGPGAQDAYLAAFGFGDSEGSAVGEGCFCGCGAKRDAHCWNTSDWEDSMPFLNSLSTSSLIHDHYCPGSDIDHLAHVWSHEESVCWSTEPGIRASELACPESYSHTTWDELDLD